MPYDRKQGYEKLEKYEKLAKAERGRGTRKNVEIKDQSNPSDDKWNCNPQNYKSRFPALHQRCPEQCTRSS